MSGGKPSDTDQFGTEFSDDLIERLKAAQAAGRRKRIEAEARPGESWQAVADRILKDSQQQPTITAPSVRKPPKGDAQPDLFVPLL